MGSQSRCAMVLVSRGGKLSAKQRKHAETLRILVRPLFPPKRTALGSLPT